MQDKRNVTEVIWGREGIKVPVGFYFKEVFSFWPWWVFVAAPAFSSCGEWGVSLVEVQGLLIAVASFVKHGLLVHRLQ